MPSFECIVLLKRLLKGEKKKKQQIMTFLVFLLTTFSNIEEPMLNILAPSEESLLSSASAYVF